MKRFWAFFAMFFMFALAVEPVEAKKFGGSRSYGKSYQTAPQQPAAKPDMMQQQNAAQRQAPAAAGSAAKKGLMGGLLGGLLAGGLFAALLGSGAFEGLQIMDILIMALIAFVIFKLLRSRRPAPSTPAYAGPGMGQPPADQRRTFDLGNPGGDATPAPAAPASAGFGESAVPFNLPAGFDMNGFLAGARDHYRTLQDAWNKNDLAKIQEYVSPDLFEELRADRATLEGEQHTEVMFVDAELVRADQVGQRAEVSIRFSGRYRDKVEGVEEPITDIWHLERDLSQPGAPWYIVGIEA